MSTISLSLTTPFSSAHLVEEATPQLIPNRETESAASTSADGKAAELEAAEKGMPSTEQKPEDGMPQDSTAIVGAEATTFSKQEPDGKTEGAACADGTSADVKMSEDGIQGSTEMKFKVNFDHPKMKARIEVTAPGNQPIIEALRDDFRLDKIKKDFTKVFLYPLDDSNIKGEPNIGNPCSSIAGGKFEARFNTKLKYGQGLSVYNDDDLKARERYKFYLDVSEQRSKSQWITKMEPTKYHFRTLLIDCLPNDTLLSALLRDGRIDNSKVRKSELTYRAHSVKLTDGVYGYHDKTFVSKVLDDPQVRDDDWQKALDKIRSNDPVVNSPTHEGRIGPNKTESPSHEERVDKSMPSTSGATPKVGSPSSPANKPDEKMYTKWQTLVAAVLNLALPALQAIESEEEDKKRRKKLDKIAAPFVKKFHNVNEVRSVRLVKTIMSFSDSVGILNKETDPHGTCFRVGQVYVMTNKHVADAAGLCGEGRGDVFVEFNYLDPLFPKSSDSHFKVKRLVYCSPELDYCVLELDIPSGELDSFQQRFPGLGHLIGPISMEGTVAIIGHPGGHDKKSHLSCPVVSATSAPEAVYHRFYEQLTHQAAATYRTVFGHGSSGSPGFDGDGKLVVMHTMGFYLHTGSPSVMELGVKMTAIFDDLRKNNHDLFCTIFPRELWDKVWPEIEEPMDCS
ncbi:serine protease FAM111A-like [Branchiostoma lanceolatum]|uniref:serine protease FAM111A-like n=1 Tax=Branchiostoma lanceolatum TaxID=7740 RepID=UPI0034537312